MNNATENTSSTRLYELENHGDFISRHIGPRSHDIDHMLKVVGADSLDSLLEATLPPGILDKTPLALDEPLSESDALARLQTMAELNQNRHNMIGQGYSETVTPAVILRNLFENPGWYTAYTPYQAEISQGRMEAVLNFQQMVSDLTGMELANASLLDEATAAAEAMAQLKRLNRRNKSLRFIADQRCFPQTLDVLRTRAHHYGFELVVGDPGVELSSGDCFGILLQYPAADGAVSDPEALIEAAHEASALVAVATDLMSLVLLKPPGEMGADVVLGNSQRFGVPMGYGGPHAAFYATHEANARSMPGRVIGVSKDRHDQPALRMALQTREQHIRRDKATSNICTSQALLAGMAGMYAVYHGPSRLKKMALRMHRQACLLAAGLTQLGLPPRHEHFFDTLTIDVPQAQFDKLLVGAEKAGINLHRGADQSVGISVGENTQSAHLEALLEVFASSQDTPTLHHLDSNLADDHLAITRPLQRSTAFLQHPVFNSYHSETEMLRYLKRLESRDLSLVHAMIPLGSCTMKLNATTEMIPVTWPGFGAMHPFAPLEQAQGYQELIDDLEQMLVACTGYDAVSLQPNAGSQGEYGGLLTIRAYHDANGDQDRDICLIPSSAHGTNPASAAMAGMKVVVVGCDANGNVDVDDLRDKAEKHSATLAALMITYPSTHGVYEEHVELLCEIVHQHGGQVYLDGANLNALVGYAGPGNFGADVSHLNLHKTFCIPHGGGGPGVGPLCVKQHLAPFLPGHKVVQMPGAHAQNGAVSAAPWGSAGILPISWAYIAMMGPEGMKRATAVAILSANYIARRLEGAFDVLYTGRGGHVAHECIIDLRPFKSLCAITEEDVAKRLIDYGFHAPTMSFPVPGTLMIEPTESESLAEVDRFCDAMLSIRQEIRAVENGEWPQDDNPLVNAPHTPRDLTREWSHPYSRETAVYPTNTLWERKFWPHVSRVDNVYGDRNLFCACLPMDVWKEDAGA